MAKYLKKNMSFGKKDVLYKYVFTEIEMKSPNFINRYIR